MPVLHFVPAGPPAWPPMPMWSAPPPPSPRWCPQQPLVWRLGRQLPRTRQGQPHNAGGSIEGGSNGPAQMGEWSQGPRMCLLPLDDESYPHLQTRRRHRRHHGGGWVTSMTRIMTRRRGGTDICILRYIFFLLIDIWSFKLKGFFKNICITWKYKNIILINKLDNMCHCIYYLWNREKTGHGEDGRQKFMQHELTLVTSLLNINQRRCVSWKGERDMRPWRNRLCPLEALQILTLHWDHHHLSINLLLLSIYRWMLNVLSCIVTIVLVFCHVRDHANIWKYWSLFIFMYNVLFCVYRNNLLRHCICLGHI